ncbi:type I glyceraldehyde-3-phosphate dehydrogenase [Candidatus Peregrinibacteria bacterium CG11_big_fil_rev_8_21_14_0_20_41_10]|nr:MAG: type I glyceraldehyde-3-phosphate dehydrogenase [Candidatus Peregrinibacteria bacterium CG11_big_fil_rev_8_21_14_0_20_41_10]PIZ77166.1 MAG: type I glyceraldehyde-3-phosphate dehydrogenase [Candidatus Peregrinibacteria bacterium CG_4_10_14_0_2_um_filter_41_8]PJC38167.1 MAG: type I glyceraldehyde-3-phosphate dehydrogenase [Candidatus Peregrinibacteria bacterium CG_4_9_14_0_2_um_filter_41_14]
MPRVAINGFGRIGRLAFRANLINPVIDIVSVNDLSGPEQAAHLLKWDSVYGQLNADVQVKEDGITVNGKFIKVHSEREPTNLPWAAENIDVVMECTGIFRTKETAGKHLKAGAKKVVISAPGKDDMPTFCIGVNEDTYNSADHIVSNASCTTNCLAPIAKIINDEFGIKRATITTTHSYTSSQNLVDGSNKDARRGRAAALSFFPTSTGAAKAVSLVIPELEGKFQGMAIRIPSPTVSIVDLVAEVAKDTTIEEINELFKRYSQGKLKGIVDISYVPLVSVDYQGNPNSAIVDAEYTNVIGGNLIKVIAWYDNEWGYANRLNDMSAHIMK